MRRSVSTRRSASSTQRKAIISDKGNADQAEALLTRAKSDAALAASLSREAQLKAKAAEPMGTGADRTPAKPER